MNFFRITKLFLIRAVAVIATWTVRIETFAHNYQQ